MAEHVFTGQVNMGIANTLKIARPIPAIADRIFDTRAAIHEFLDRQYTSAIPGLLLSVIKEGEHNGVYRVVEGGDGPNKLTIEEVGGGNVVILTNTVRKSIINGTSATKGLEVKLATHPGSDNSDVSGADSYASFIVRENTYKKGDREHKVYDESGRMLVPRAAVNASGLDVVEATDAIGDEHGRYNEGLKVKLMHHVEPLNTSQGLTRSDWRREDGTKNYNISGLEIHANTISSGATKGGGATSKGLAVKPGKGIIVDRTGVNTNGKIIELGTSPDDVLTPNTDIGGFESGEPIPGNTNIYDLFRRLIEKTFDVVPFRPTTKGIVLFLPFHENKSNPVYYNIPDEGETWYVEPGWGGEVFTSSSYTDGKFVCDPEGVDTTGHTWLNSANDSWQQDGDGFVWAKCKAGSVYWFPIEGDITFNSGGTMADSYYDYIPVKNIDGQCWYGKGSLRPGDTRQYELNVNYAKSTRQGEQASNMIKRMRSNKGISRQEISTGVAIYKSGNIVCSAEIFVGFGPAQTDHSVNVLSSTNNGFDQEYIATDSIDALVNSIPVSVNGSAESMRFLTAQKGTTVPSTLGTPALPNPIIVVPKGMKPVSAVDASGRLLNATDLSTIFVKQPTSTVSYVYGPSHTGTTPEKCGGGVYHYDVYTSYQCEPAELLDVKFE